VTKPRLLLAATGGTIANRLDTQGLNEERATAADLIQVIPELMQEADIVPVDVFQLPSYAFTPEHMREMAVVLERAQRDGCDGAVVTMGTDAMEETAYALALMLRRQFPVVLTGAMRPPSNPGADGAANLTAAVRVALTQEIANLGPVVVMQDEIHMARYVTKAHTARVAAFASPGLGPVGSIVEGRVRLAVGSTAFDDFLGMPDAVTARVALLWVCAGMDGRWTDDATRDCDGVVVAGAGGGHLPPEVAEPLRLVIERGCPVVLASRTGSGSVLERTYSGVGSETELLRTGFVPAGGLSPLKARLRLLVGLALGRNVRELFPA
jgi:L-asparaginase